MKQLFWKFPKEFWPVMSLIVFVWAMTAYLQWHAGEEYGEKHCHKEIHNNN